MQMKTNIDKNILVISEVYQRFFKEKDDLISFQLL